MANGQKLAEICPKNCNGPDHANSLYSGHPYVYTPPQKSQAPFRLCWRFLPITWRNSSETLLTFVET